MEKKFLAPGKGSFWLLTAVSALQTGQVQVINPLIFRYAGSLGIGADLSGLLVGAFSAAALLSRPLSVFLCGKCPFRLLACLSSAAMGGASLFYFFPSLFSRSSAPYLLLGVRLLHGFSYALCTTVLMTMAGAMLPGEQARRGMSLFGIGQVLSAALAPAAGIALSSAFGEAPAFFLSAAMAAGASLAVLFLPSLGPAETKSPRGNSPAKTPGKTSRRRIFSLQRVSAAAAITFASSLETAFLVVYAESLSVSHTGWYFTVSALGMLLVRALGGRSPGAGRKSRFSKTAALCLSVMAVSMLLLCLCGLFSAPAAFWLLLLAAAVKALGQGAGQPAIQAECLRRERGSSAAAGLYYFGCDVGQALGPIAGGFLLPAFGYSGVWLSAALLLLLNAGFVLTAAGSRSPSGR